MGCSRRTGTSPRSPFTWGTARTPSVGSLIDLATGRIDLVNEAIVPTPYVFLDWAPSGDTVYLTGGQLAGRRPDRRILDRRCLGAVLDVSVGDFYGMAAFQASTEAG